MTAAIKPLPTPLLEPMVYLSELQQPVIDRRSNLRDALAAFALPCWVPHRVIADALGHAPELRHAVMEGDFGDRPWHYTPEPDANPEFYSAEDAASIPPKFVGPGNAAVPAMYNPNGNERFQAFQYAKMMREPSIVKDETFFQKPNHSCTKESIE